MDATTIGVISAAVGSLFGIAATKGVDGLVKWHKARHDSKAADMKVDDDRADAWARITIEQLRADMTAMRAELSTVRSEHLNCERTQGELKVEIAVLRAQVTRNQEAAKA